MPSFRISQTKELVSLATAEIALAFSLDDGGLRALQRIGGPNVVGYGVGMPAIDVNLGGQGWIAEQTFVRYLSHSVDDRGDAVEVVIVIGIGPLMVYDRYRITGTLIARRVSIRNVGEDDVVLNGLRLSLPWARVGSLDTCCFEAPGNSVRPQVALEVAAAQRRGVLPRRFFAPGLRDAQAMERAPNQGLSVMALHDTAGEEALLCWYYSTNDLARPQVHGNDVAVTLTHEIAAQDRLPSEGALVGGTQYIMLVRDAWPAPLDALRRTWPVVGVHGFDRCVEWLADAAVYEVHPSYYGGFRGLLAALPTVRALGINTLCLLPIWEFDNPHGRMWDVNWECSGNPYSLIDFNTLDPTLGTPEDMRALVSAAHAHGLRVVLDLPLEGCAAGSTVFADHPDWFCFGESGKPLTISAVDKTIAYDWANDELRAFILQWAMAQARSFNLDGYRMILPQTTVLNWSRADRGQVGGGGLAILDLIERLQFELKQYKADAALIADQSGPLYAQWVDGKVEHLPHHMFVHLALNRVDPEEIGEWLADYARSLPYNSASLCYTETYRTRLSNPLVDGLRGSRISRMILAGLVLSGFVPSVRAGQEHDEGEWIAALLRAREEHVALRRGGIAHNVLPCSSKQVLAVLREYERDHLIGLLNVSANKQTVTLSLPIDRLVLVEGDYELYSIFDQKTWSEAGRSAWRRDELLALRLTLEPFAAYCFAVRSAPVVQLEPLKSVAPQHDSKQSSAEPDRMPTLLHTGEAVGGMNGHTQRKRS